MKDFPLALLRKWIFTLAMGVGCLGIGFVYFFFSEDGVLLGLSGLVFGFSLLRSIFLYKTISGHDYETVEGTCVAITNRPLRKCRRIRIMDDHGIKSTLLLAKQAKVKIGYQYRFFFKKTTRPSLGSEFLDTALSTDCFLGYEELGEFPGADAGSFSSSEEKTEK
ncbi:MAG: hypothetical protein H6Q60_1544 [Oscillospiraceae bacterium]|nr:hypothetical protein [Oscillospiraceae bacterium]